MIDKELRKRFEEASRKGEEISKKLGLTEEDVIKMCLDKNRVQSELPKFPKRKELLEVIEFLDEYPFPLTASGLLEKVNYLIKVIEKEVDTNEEFVAQLETEHEIKRKNLKLYAPSEPLYAKICGEMDEIEKVLEAFKG